MTKEIHQGLHKAIAHAYLKGERIEFRSADLCREWGWKDVAAYREPLDIYRISGEKYEFRIKPKTTSANIHVHKLTSGTVWATADQQPCADNIKVTFDENGTPIKAEIL